MPEEFFAAQPSSDQIREKMAGMGAWFEIDLDRLTGNLNAIRERTGAEVMPVVKNNAYGHGLRPVSSSLARDGVKWLMVAKLAEALAIKSWGLPCNVVNMDMLYTNEQFDQVVESGVTPRSSIPVPWLKD